MPRCRMFRSSLFAVLVGLLVGQAHPQAVRAAADDPPGAMARFESGQSLFKDGKYRQAAEAFEQAQREGLKDHHVYNWLGDAYLKLQDFDRAVAAYSGLIRLGEEGSCEVCMRKAYTGRAAAYMAKGDYAQATADCDEVVLRWLQTVRDYPDDAEFMRDCARAYRDRSQALRARGHTTTAALDDDRAARLETEAAARPAPRARANLKPSGSIRLLNDWTAPVMVVVDGVEYRLQPGTQPTVIPHDPGTFNFEVPGIQAPATRTLEVGHTYTVRLKPR